MILIRKVTLAGGTGRTGKPMLRALVDSGFDITLLTRNGMPTKVRGSFQMSEVDHGDVSSLTKVLEGQERSD